ncbi:hypothetical protein [Clostridium massiliamazoniense]|uniref:hypothetical protein n=1 Tax=Clostridium massiliamazoniense TaxID=1347366 RepID=UPI0006D76D13|nr:hypothetical protein [Clostridium massiliamazoniense]
MRKKRIILLMSLGLSAFALKGGATEVVNHKPVSTNRVLLVANNSQGQSIEYKDNNLSDISSANPEQFDNPQVGPRGILERMQSTTINTKYGEMSIERVQDGFQCKNLSNPNAPVLFVSAVNNIYEVGGQTDLKGFLSPKIVNGQGTIILPNVNTSEANFGVKYVEAIGTNGAITIAPFIYNTVQFKNSVNVKAEGDINSLTLNDVLEGPSNDLKLYIANYDKGSKVVTIGLSRGVASIQKALPLTIGSSTDTSKTNVDTGTANQNTSAIQKNNVKVPLLIQILLSKWTYIIVGIILIAIVSFFCFTGL